LPFDRAVEDVLVMGRRFIAEGMDSYEVAMLLDLKNRRRTEIDNTAGVIVRTAQRASIEVPYTEFAWRLIRGIEGTFM
jgi:ketopantoate reductase